MAPAPRRCCAACLHAICEWESNLTTAGDLLECQRRVLRSMGVDRLVAAGARVHPGARLRDAVVGERAVIERGSVPEDVASDIRTVERARATRRARIIGERHELASAVLHLTPGVRVERRPVLGEGEFVWGHVLLTDGHPEGAPCSAFVATLLSMLDGRTSTTDLIARLAQGRDEQQAAQIARTVLAALEILYVDGTVERAE